MTVGGMGFIPERLLMMMMMITNSSNSNELINNSKITQIITVKIAYGLTEKVQ